MLPTEHRMINDMTRNTTPIIGDQNPLAGFQKYQNIRVFGATRRRIIIANSQNISIGEAVAEGRNDGMINIFIDQKRG